VLFFVLASLLAEYAWYNLPYFEFALSWR